MEYNKRKNTEQKDRFMKRSSKKISLIYIWMLTYMCALLVPACANFILYNNFSAKFEQEIQSYNSLLMDKVQSEFDEKISNYLHFIFMLESDAQLRKIATYPEKTNNEQWQEMNQFVHNKLRQYVWQLPQDFYIYMKKSGSVVKLDYISSGEVAYQVWGTPYAATYSEWITKMNGSYQYGFELNEEYRLVSYHTLFSGTDYEITLVATLADKTILDFEQSFSTEQGRSLEICERGKAVNVSLGNSEVELDFAENNNTSGRIVFQSTDKTKYIAVYAKSTIMDWNYVIITEDTFFYRVQQQMRNVWLFTIMIGVVLSLIFAALFSYYNYAPLYKIIKKFGKPKEKNEYQYLETLLHQLQYTQTKTRNERFLSEYLTRSVYTAHMEEQLKERYGIDNQTKLMVVVIFFQDVSAFVSNQNVEHDFDAMCFAVENVFAEMMAQRGCRANMVSTKGAVNAIVCVEEKEMVLEQLEQFIEFVEEQLRISCLVVCGECLRGIENISVSYRQAMGVLDYMFFVDDSDTIGIYDAKESMLYEKYTKKTEQEILLAFLSNKPDEVKALIDKIFRCAPEKPKLPEAQMVLKSITEAIIAKVKEQSKNTNMDDTELKEALRSRSLEEYYEHLTNFMSVYYGNEPVQEKNFFKQIQQYVDEHIADPELTNGKIAEQFNISEVYLSRYFKSNYSDGLLNYIIKSRVKIAKNILKNTDKTINEIAQEAGFANSLALLRAFKKHEGVTPTQYRELNKH